MDRVGDWAAGGPRAVAELSEELDRLQLPDPRGRVHPALDVDVHGVYVGVVTEGGDYELITSGGTRWEGAEVKPRRGLAPRPYPDLAGRWPDADRHDWLHAPSAPTFAETLALTMHVFDDAMELPRREHQALLAVWSLATYFFPLFLTFPRLNLSGERESGKSKVLTLLRATAWNALLIVSPTPAVLYRLIQEFRPTLLLDEVEGLHKDDARDVLAILNSGYKAGGSVPRCEGEKTKRVELFQVYAPVALAAIKHVHPVTEDRCIPVVLQRGTDPTRLNREVDLSAPSLRGCGVGPIGCC